MPGQCRVAIAALPAHTGDLKGSLFEIHVVGLHRVSSGVSSRHRNVNRVVESKALVDHGAGKKSIATVARAVTAGDHIRAHQIELRPVTESEYSLSFAQRYIAGSTMTSHASDLDRALI